MDIDGNFLINNMRSPWIVRVLVGWFNRIFKREQTLANKRLAICNKCEYRKKIGRLHYCGLCYCELKAKCSSPEEKCLNDKW